ncbi:MAG: L-lactate permease [Eubacteriales bacterium]|nr:L-lactate permease [Eubacteriales bacterium]
MLPVNFLMWGAAFAPIVVLILLMVGFNWSARKAAPISLAIAVLNGLLLYKASFSMVLLEGAKGAWSALSVFFVILPAILIYEVTNEAKAFDVFRAGMQKFSPNELLQIIMVGWVFVSFLQGITGFGVPVAVGAPLLIGIGLKPYYAVLIPLIAHAWGNTFGTLGLAWEALVETSGVAASGGSTISLALWACAFIWFFNAVGGFILCWLYGKAKAVKKGLPAVLLISLVHGGGQLLVSLFNPIIAAFIPATLALVVAMLLGRSKLYNQAWRIEDTPCMERSPGLSTSQSDSSLAAEKMSLVQAFSPFIVLVLLTFIGLVIRPINNLLKQWMIGFSFPETTTGYGFSNPAIAKYAPIGPLVHAGTFLFLSALAGYFYFRKHNFVKAGSMQKIFKRALKKAIPSITSVLLLLVMSKIMSGTGQTDVLAEGTAMVLGKYYAALAPFIGVLGSFMTSSNMASNILFGKFQAITASSLGLNINSILGAQTCGGAIGASISPGNIVLATTTAGIPGQEGSVLRRTLPIALSLALIIGAVLLATVFFF